MWLSMGTPVLVLSSFSVIRPPSTMVERLATVTLVIRRSVPMMGTLFSATTCWPTTVSLIWAMVRLTSLLLLMSGMTSSLRTTSWNAMLVRTLVLSARSVTLLVGTGMRRPEVMTAFLLLAA